MKPIAALAAALLAASSNAARAEPAQSVFCVAVRTVPMLDQDNYVMGATGPVYATASFTTSTPMDQLIGQWRGFIAARHPVAYPGNPDDTCYPANSRRAFLRGQHGDVRVRSVAWTPDKP